MLRNFIKKFHFFNCPTRKLEHRNLFGRAIEIPIRWMFSSTPRAKNVCLSYPIKYCERHRKNSALQKIPFRWDLVVFNYDTEMLSAFTR